MDEKIKICEMLDSYYPCIDGPINVVKNYSKNLNKKAECVLAVPKADPKQNYVDNEEFEVWRCASSSAPENYRLGHPDFDGEFVDKMDAAGFDIIHVHSPFSMGRFGMHEGVKLKIPVVATLHTKYFDDFLRVTKSKFLSKIALSYIMGVYKGVDSVWTVNDASRQVLRDYGYKGDIEVVRNGTDLKYPDNADELIEKVNDLHGLKGKKNVFIFVGRIAMYKNLGLLLDALKILKDDGVDFTMLIIGNGFDLEKVKSLSTGLGLDDNVIFTGSVSDRSLLQGYYLRSDLFLFPSTFDTSSLVPIEAAAHKLPTLLIKGSCTAENIKDGVNGFLAEETACAYAKRIKEIVADEKLREQVGEECHRSVYRSWEMVAEEVLEKYKEVIKRYNEKKKK